MAFGNEEPMIYHYPDIMITYFPDIPVTSTPAFEFFKKGKFISTATDYFSNVDSVAVKYIIGENVTYTNFYCRSADQKWKAYSSNRKFCGIISEFRKDTLIVSHYSAHATIIYYRVK